MGAKLVDLFTAFFKVSLLSFGGGYTQIPLIEHQVVEIYKWVTHDEFLKIVGASEAIPGAIAIKFATYIGYKEAGFLGVIVTIIGSFIVPIISILIIFYVLKRIESYPIADRVLKGIKSATWGLIIGFGVQLMMGTSFEAKNIVIGVGALVAITVLGVSAPIIIIAAGILGILIYK